ncbi:52 kDa repressor of the inhibitor of the protein kinase-like, partial [Aphis craccivora]
IFSLVASYASMCLVVCYNLILSRKYVIMSKRKYNPILEMFNKKQKKDQNDEEELNVSNVLQLNSDSPANNECNDVGVLLETKTIFTYKIRKHLLTNPLIPHQNDLLPYSEHLKKGNILKQIKENRSRLLPIVDTIITMGKQNIPFRGHRDDGNLLGEPKNFSITNEENFRAILRMLRDHYRDDELKNHLQKSSQTATYISKTIQNELIDICGKIISNKILKQISDNKLYSIEDFISFVDVHKVNFEILENDVEPKTTGTLLGKTVVKIMNQNGLNLDYCVGICTDTCSVMASEQAGAISKIRKHTKNAARALCRSHALNLALSKSANIPSIRNCFGTIKEIIAFFHSSAKRNFVLKQKLGSELSGLCDTRWVERHESLMFFNDNLLKILQALEIISTWDDVTSSSKSHCFVRCLTSTDFIVSVKIINLIFTITRSLSKSLQKQSLNVNTATELISNTRQIIQNERYQANITFNRIWKTILDISEKLNIVLCMPRLSVKQTYRSNIPSDTVEDYYRKNTFIPLLDAIISDFDQRFDKNTVPIEIVLSFLLPKKTSQLHTEELQKVISHLWEAYSELLNTNISTYNNENIFKSEVELWKAKCNSNNTIYGELDNIELLKLCDEDIYPNYNFLIKILVVLPVTVSSAERSFSTLKRMSEDRLVGLALLNVHNDIEILPDEVIDQFAKSKNRKLDLIL